MTGSMAICGRNYFQPEFACQRQSFEDQNTLIILVHCSVNSCNTALRSSTCIVPRDAARMLESDESVPFIPPAHIPYSGRYKLAVLKSQMAAGGGGALLAW